MADEKPLREQLLSANKFKSVKVQVAIPGGPAEVEVRCPNVAQRNRIIQALKEDMGRAQALACVLCARKPDGSGAAVFLEEDVPALMEMPANGVVDAIAEAAFTLLNKAEESAKN